ncbi:Unknown protein [Striga hermonthica]|uniref:DUF8040 domain-containing protein n=1 Tax=Striga hermonthica TaxID=68872 RepID=A0A9N7RGX4_STRHE|nr:Unknown protein [Striga hermonthica]
MSYVDDSDTYEEDIDDLPEDVDNEFKTVEEYDPFEASLMMGAQFQQLVNIYESSSSAFPPLRRIPYRESTYSGLDWVNELLAGNPRRFKDAMGINQCHFTILCDEIKRAGFHPKRRQTKIGIEESVAIFLHTIKGHQRQRFAAETFRKSGETISRHCHKVINALCYLASDYIRPPDFNRVAPWIRNNRNLYPYFKDCIGAIDGTITWVPEGQQGSYRCRKGYLAQNVMLACDFDLKFTFVLAGWEGSANNARIFNQTLSDPRYNFPYPPPGKLNMTRLKCYTVV